MKNLFYLPLILPILFTSCNDDGLFSGNDDEISINYPDSGVFGVNILRSDSTEVRGTNPNNPYSSFPYSFRAELSEGASLEVIMTSTASSIWSFEISSEEGWIVDDLLTHKQRFIAYGPNISELEMTFYGSGSAELEIFENGSETPTRVKTIAWQP
jgi:hypothetical protein